MALVVNDRVKETTTVAGTGTATLLGAALGYQSFAVIGNGNTTYYCIADQGGSNWEVGLGTYTSSGTTLARTTVLSSSNAGALVVFPAGTKDVFCTYPSERSVHQDQTLTAYVPQVAASNGLVLNNSTVSTSYTIPTGYNATATGPMTIASGAVVTVPSGSRWMVL
jgi:hypothetical protein